MSKPMDADDKAHIDAINAQYETTRQGGELPDIDNARAFIVRALAAELAERREEITRIKRLLIEAKVPGIYVQQVREQAEEINSLRQAQATALAELDARVKELELELRAADAAGRLMETQRDELKARYASVSCTLNEELLNMTTAHRKIADLSQLLQKERNAHEDTRSARDELKATLARVMEVKP